MTFEWSHFCVALGIGLLIGLERERSKGEGPRRRPAGIRTFALASLLGAVAFHLGGGWLLCVATAGVAALTAISHRRSQELDPGLTTEIGLVVVPLLGALAMTEPLLAAGLAVAVAVIFAAKVPLHGFAKGALSDAMKRVAAIAVVHEILSQAFDSSVKFDDVADRLLRMVGDVAATGGKVRMVLQGTFGYVPADVATSLSLVLTELCQNAIEHGLRDKAGEVLVIPQQSDGELNVVVKNFGEPLPEDFRIGRSTSLGLSIVSTLVADLGGQFTLASDDDATTATVRVPLR